MDTPSRRSEYRVDAERPEYHLDDARREWAERHIPVAVRAMRKFRGGLDPDLALSAAYAGLCRAAATYSESKGVPDHWIYWHVRKYINEEKAAVRTIRVPYAKRHTYRRFPIHEIEAGYNAAQVGAGDGDLRMDSVATNIIEKISIEDKSMSRVDADDDMDALRDILGVLTERQRRAVEMARGGMGYGEMAEAMGVDADGARRHFWRGVAAIRHEIRRRATFAKRADGGGARPSGRY